MNRRGILALLGGAVAMPGAVGAKTAAAIMGIDPHSPSPMPATQVVEARCAGPISGSFWGTPTQIAFQAGQSARHEAATDANRYSHMKSWGPAFRRSVIAREMQVEIMFEHKCREDSEFFAKVIGMMK